MRPQHLGKLSVPTAKGFELVNLHSIEYFESDDQVTRIFRMEGPVIIGNKNIGYFEDELKDLPFERVHNQIIVNLAAIKEYIRQEGVITLLSGKKVSVSREKAKKLLKFLKTGSVSEEAEGKILAVLHHKEANESLAVRSGKWTVGRKSDNKPCDIMVDTKDRSMSRNHFYLEAKENAGGSAGLFLGISETAKKTLINGTRVQAGEPTRLFDQDIITAGETELVVELMRQPGHDTEHTLTSMPSN